MIADIVELLKEKDSKFEKLFNEACLAGKVDIIGKLDTKKPIKSKSCTIKYNREIQGVEIKIDGYDICICEVGELELRDVKAYGEDLKFAYIKCKEEGVFAEYAYNIDYDNKCFVLRSTAMKSGYTCPRIIGDTELSDENIGVLTGNSVLVL